MRNMMVLMGLAMAGPAMAGPWEKYSGTPKSVEIDGTVEVPLYESPWGAPDNVVIVEIGDERLRFELGTSGSSNYITQSTAKKLKLKTKEGNTKLLNFKGEDHKGKYGTVVDHVIVEEARLGDLVLRDVVFWTNPEEKDDKGREALFEDVPEGAPSLAGTLNLMALEQLSWAVLPSEGVVRFAPAGDASLVSAVSDQPLTYTSQESFVFKFEKDKFVMPATPLVVPSTIGGTNMSAQLNLGSWYNGVLRDEAPEMRLVERGDIAVGKAEIVVGGVNSPLSDWVVLTPNELVSELVELPIQAGIGQNWLHSMDLACDPASKQIAIRLATENKRQDPRPGALTYAESKMTAPEDAPEDWKPGVAEYGHLASAQKANRLWDEALQTYQTLTEEEPRNCDAFENIGLLHQRLGNQEEALAAFQRASELYHSWWDMPLEQRQDLEKALSKLDPDEQKAHEHKAQPVNCHTADGYVAEALLNLNQYEEASAFYAKRDLDGSVAEAAAAAAIMQGDWDKAIEAYRQQVLMDRNNRHSHGYRGLGIAHLERGDWTNAKALLERWMVEYFNHDVDNIRLWTHALADQEGPDAALALVKQLAEDNPGPDEWLAVYRAAIDFDDPTLAAEALAQAKEVHAHELLWAPNISWVWATDARIKLAEGDLEAAAASAEKALALNPNGDDSLRANAEVALAGDDPETAKKHLAKEAQGSYPISVHLRRALEGDELPSWVIPPTGKQADKAEPAE